MQLSKLILSSWRRHSEVSIPIFIRAVGPKRLSSSICARSVVGNVTRHPPTYQAIKGHPQCLNFLKRFGSCKRYYTSSRSTKGNKPPYILPEPAETPISWRYFLIPGSALLGIGGLVLLFHYNDERRAVPKGQGEKFERSSIQGPIIGGPFSLIDTEGNVVTEKNLLGNWVLLYFGYTSSPDVGALEVQKIANTLKILESKQIKLLPIFVTIDPQRDNPAHLRAYLREFDSRIVGLTGPVGAIRQMAQEYRVFFKKVDEEGSDYLVESSHNMYMLNPNMEVTRSFGIEYGAQELAESITSELKKDSNVNKPI